jgi:hypothetical protein
LSTEAATPAAAPERLTEFSIAANVARLLCVAVPVAIWFNRKDLFRIGLWLTIVESVLLLLLVPFFWPLIGI